MGPFTPQNCFQAPSAGAFPSKTRGRTTTRPAPLPSGRGTPNNPKIPEADPFALSHTRGVAGVRLAGHLNSKQRKSKGNNRVFIPRRRTLFSLPIHYHRPRRCMASKCLALERWRHRESARQQSGPFLSKLRSPLYRAVIRRCRRKSLPIHWLGQGAFASDRTGLRHCSFLRRRAFRSSEYRGFVDHFQRRLDRDVSH